VSRGPKGIILPNFVKIGETVAQIWQFIDFFSRWRPSGNVDHRRRILDGLYRFSKFGCNWCSSVRNMNVIISSTFGLKTLIHDMGSNINVTPKQIAEAIFEISHFV